MTGAASRRRGANAERMVAEYLRTHGWPDARRYLAGDGRQRLLGDIDAVPGVAIEVKDRAQSAWTGWLDELERDNDRVTVVVRRVRGTTDVGRWPAVIGSERQWLNELDGVPALVTIPSVNCHAEHWITKYGRIKWVDATGHARIVTNFADVARAMRPAA